MIFPVRLPQGIYIVPLIPVPGTVYPRAGHVRVSMLLCAWSVVNGVVTREALLEKWLTKPAKPVQCRKALESHL